MKEIYQTLFRTYEYFLDLILPRSCAGCRRAREAFCELCQTKSFQKYFGCLICGARNQTGSFCTGSCRKKTPLSIKRVYWAGRYDDELKDAIWQLKYKKRREIAEPLGTMLAQKFLLTKYAAEPNNCCIIAIPLHENRERERGFNQAKCIAESFVQKTSIPIAYNVLLKTKETAPQVHTRDRKERQKNLEGAFSVNPKAFEACRDKTIILVDDVATTGATLFHASSALAEAGAKNIIGLVVAHG